MGNTLVSTLDAKKAKKVDTYFLRNPRFTNKLLLSDNKLFKTYSCNIENEAHIIMKIYLKRDNIEIKNYEESFRLLNRKININEYCNFLPYTRLLEESDFVVLCRPKINLTLQERFHTVPYLKSIEKRWICFQLLTALYALHNHIGLYHGDIKSSNILLTTWNHIFLADFACYKPNYVFEDKLEDIKYFYPTYSNKCNFAPEKFIAKGTQENQVIWFSDDLTKIPPDILFNLQKMDIFSAGCVIAEIMLDGRSLFTYEQLIAYRRDEYNPEELILRIKNEKIQQIIRDMIQKDPMKRKDIKSLVIEWCTELIPQSVPKLIYYINANLISNHFILPDQRIALIREMLDAVYSEVLQAKMLPHYESLPPQIQAFNAKNYFIKRFQDIKPNFLELLGLEKPQFLTKKPKCLQEGFQYEHMHNIYEKDPKIMAEKASLTSSIQLNNNNSSTANQTNPNGIYSNNYKNKELILLIMMICVNLRSVRFLSTKLCAIEMLANFSMFLKDKEKIHIIMPYLFSLFEEQNSRVVCAAFSAFCKIAKNVHDPIQMVSDIKIFDDYILPNITKIYRHTDLLIVGVFMENFHVLINLGFTYAREAIYSDISEGKIIKQDKYNSSPTIDSTSENKTDTSTIDTSSVSATTITEISNTNKFLSKAQKKDLLEAEYKKVRDKFSKYLEEILAIQNATIHVKFLENLPELSTALGQTITETLLIPLALSSINNFPQTKLSSIKFLVEIIGLVSANTVEGWLQPSFHQCLYDHQQELVTLYCIKGFIKMLKLSKLSKSSKEKTMRTLLPFLIHPNQWIRDYVIEFFCNLIESSSLVDLYSNIQYELMKYVDKDSEGIPLLNADLFRMVVIMPINRRIYEDIKDIKGNKYNYKDHGEQLPKLIENLREGFSNSPSPKDEIPEIRNATYKAKNIINILTEIYIKAKSKYIIDIEDEELRFSICKKLLDEDVMKITENKQIEKIDVPIVIKTIKYLEAYLTANLSVFSTYQLTQANYIKNVQAFLLLCHEILDKITQLQDTREKEIGYHEMLEKTILVKNWKPGGFLLTTIYEHTDAVNCLDSSCDSKIMASGSNDGTIRIFDIAKLEKEFTSNSILKIDSNSSFDDKIHKVKALKFLDNDQIVHGTDKGLIEVYKLIESKEDKKISSIINRIQESSGIKAIQPLNLGGDKKEKCYMYITQNGELIIRDNNMKSNTPAVRFNIGKERGLVSSLLMSSIDHTAVIGTYSGYVLLYDIRCNLISNVYQMNPEAPILAMSNYHPVNTNSRYFSSHNSRIAISFGSDHHEFGIWNFHDFQKDCQNPELYFLSSYNTEKYNMVSYLRDISRNEVIFNVKNIFKERMFYDQLALKSPIYNILSFYSDPLHQHQNVVKDKWLSHTKNLYVKTTKIFQYQNYIKKILCLPKLSNRDLQSQMLLTKDYDNVIITAGNDLNLRFWNLTANQFYHVSNSDGLKRVYNIMPGDTTIINETLSRPELEYIKQQQNGGRPIEKSFSDYQFKNGYSLNTSNNLEKHHLSSSSHKDLINDILYMEKNDVLVTCSRDHTIKLWK